MWVREMKELYMRNYLHNTDIYLNQRRDMFRINTDTALLGEFLKCKEGDKVLDIGTNNGALLLYASTHHPSLLCGVDVFDEALELCKGNLEDNGITNYELYKTKVQDFQHEPFDVIFCNPPYFNNTEGSKMLNQNEFMRVARHEVNLTMEELFESVSRLLIDKGTFYMVHRANRLNDIIVLSNKYNLGIINIKFIYDENNDEAVQILVEARKNICHNISILRPAYITR